MGAQTLNLLSEKDELGLVGVEVEGGGALWWDCNNAVSGNTPLPPLALFMNNGFCVTLVQVYRSIPTLGQPA